MKFIKATVKYNKDAKPGNYNETEFVFFPIEAIAYLRQIGTGLQSDYLVGFKAEYTSVLPHPHSPVEAKIDSEFFKKLQGISAQEGTK